MPKREHPRPRRGRPLKFGRPARSITITLPVDAVAALRASDPDVGQAIVALLASGARRAPEAPAVALHKTGRRMVIVVKPVEALRQLRGVELVSLGDQQRALIAFSGDLTAAQFELQIHDLLDASRLSADEALVVDQLAGILRDVRHSTNLRLSEATIMVIDDVQAPAAKGNVRARSARTQNRRSRAHPSIPLDV